MSNLPSPQERAQSLVVARSRLPGAPWYVELTGLLEPPFLICPYVNPAVAREDAERIQEFGAAVIREARQAAP